MKCDRLLIHKRWTSLAANLKSIDDLPGSFDLSPPEMVAQMMTDSVSIFSEHYETAIRENPSAPMIKMNGSGFPAVALLSHDLVKQWHHYELTGRVRRASSPQITKLMGRPFNDMTGPDHSIWRKKAMPSFKPQMVDRFCPFIQRSATNILLDGIYQATKDEDDDAVQFCIQCGRIRRRQKRSERPSGHILNYRTRTLCSRSMR